VLKKSLFWRMISIILCINMAMGLLGGNVAYAAYKFPDGFWNSDGTGLIPSYEKAQKTNNYSDIIKYGIQIIEKMKTAPEAIEKFNNLAGKAYDVALAYMEIDEPLKAREYFEYLEKVLDQYTTYSNNANYKTMKENAEVALTAMDLYVDLYTDGGVSPNFSATNEKGNGVLYGVNHDSKIRAEGLTKNESIILIYQELGEKFNGYSYKCFQDASDKGCAVEYALNCPRQKEDINNIKTFERKLKEISDFFLQYPDVPVYLRFAAEFNIWDSGVPTSANFKSAFQYVSNYFKSRNKNVAMVWSPAQASRYKFNLDAYYPGDAYVDWVGLSSYAVKYYQSNPKANLMEEMFYKAGDSSHPVTAVKEIVEKYGSKKPIMISEMGTSHYVTTIKEDTTWFAQQRLREYLTYLPMVYPQIKAILYFDKYVQGETEKFTLHDNWYLKTDFLKYTQGDRFIQKSYYDETGFCYSKIYAGMSLPGIFPLYCFAHSYGKKVTKVEYFIDDKLVATASEMPFTAYIDANKYSGEHTLKAVAHTDKKTSIKATRKVKINGQPKNISVKINDEKIAFDQAPVLYNDRTMVPMRKIFESLDATVDWDGETRTVTAVSKKLNTTIKITIGSSRMYINDEMITLDTPAILLSDRTLVPVRAVAEGLNCDVGWDAKNLTVQITPKAVKPVENKWSAWMAQDDVPEEIWEDSSYEIDTKNDYRYRIGQLIYDFSDWTDWESEYNFEEDLYPDVSGDVEIKTEKRYVYRYAEKERKWYNDIDNWSSWRKSLPDYVQEDIEWYYVRSKSDLRYRYAEEYEDVSSWSEWTSDGNSYDDIYPYDAYDDGYFVKEESRTYVSVSCDDDEQSTGIVEINDLDTIEKIDEIVWNGGTDEEIDEIISYVESYGEPVDIDEENLGDVDCISASFSSGYCVTMYTDYRFKVVDVTEWSDWTDWESEYDYEYDLEENFPKHAVVDIGTRTVYAFAEKEDDWYDWVDGDWSDWMEEEDLPEDVLWELEEGEDNYFIHRRRDYRYAVYEEQVDWGDWTKWESEYDFEKDLYPDTDDDEDVDFEKRKVYRYRKK